MKEIVIKNHELKSYLYGFSNWFFNQDISGFIKESTSTPPDFTCITQAYLNDLIQKDFRHEGFPEDMRGLELSEEVLKKPQFFEFREPIRDMMFQVTAFIGARHNALTAFYPEDGYIGWHTNWNAFGYNLIFSFSENGTGLFKYFDKKTKEIVELYDEKAVWTCKAGYFGSYEEKENHFWHAAESNGSRRLTFAYVIPNEDMWLDAIEEIQNL